MKNNKKLIIGSIVVILILLCVLGSIKSEQNSNEVNTVENITNTVQSSKEIYYKYDETINKYITLFNDMYIDNKITSDMLSVYYHHGSEHENQVKFNMQNLEVLLTANYTNNISICIENPNDDNATIKKLIKYFIKVFDPSITDEKIDTYINSQGAGSNIVTYDGIEYWINKNLDGTKIEYIKITGKLQ